MTTPRALSRRLHQPTLLVWCHGCGRYAAQSTREELFEHLRRFHPETLMRTKRHRALKRPTEAPR